MNVGRIAIPHAGRALCGGTMGGRVSWTGCVRLGRAMSEEKRADALPAGRALAFEIEGRCGETAARAGIVRTPHGAVRTPVIMPVGTHATVKAVGPDDLEAIGA